MGVQEIIVIALFIAALVYTARLIFRTLKADKGCGQCGKCGADFSNIKLPKS